MKNIILLIASLTLFACGGGGGGDTGNNPAPATNTNATFVFGDYNRLSQTGDTETWNLSGTANTGESVTATITYKNTGTTSYNGNTVNVFEGLINIKIPAFSTNISTIVTHYYDSTGKMVRSLETSSGVECFPSGTTVVEPKEVKVGDFGSSQSETCSDGSTSTGTWKVEAVDSTHVNIILTETIRDSLGNISITSVAKLKIDTAGNLSDVALDASYYISGTFDFSIALTGTVQ